MLVVCVLCAPVRVLVWSCVYVCDCWCVCALLCVGLFGLCVRDCFLPRVFACVCLLAWLIGCVFDWSRVCLVGWLAGWLVGWVVCFSVRVFAQRLCVFVGLRDLLLACWFAR